MAVSFGYKWSFGTTSVRTYSCFQGGNQSNEPDWVEMESLSG